MGTVRRVHNARTLLEFQLFPLTADVLHGYFAFPAEVLAIEVSAHSVLTRVADEFP
jgi:hypothetical protein